MKIKKTSYFKDSYTDILWFENWVSELEQINQKKYQRFQVETSLGKTHVWGINTQEKDLDALVIFPGARTSSLFWDFDNNLSNLGARLRIYLVETNGLPNLSDGHTPDIASLEYGEWAAEVLDQLGIEKAFVAGASFGGLICMKLGLVRPDKISAAFLLNPGCLQPFSLTFKNLYYNLLPILVPSRKNVEKFLNKAVFSKPTHRLSAACEKLIIDYELFALTRYQDNAQKPYYMKDQLNGIKVDTYLIEGDQDVLFPFQKSINNARERISTLKDVIVFKKVGHGIETYDKALHYVGSVISTYRNTTSVSSGIQKKQLQIIL